MDGGRGEGHDGEREIGRGRVCALVCVVLVRAESEDGRPGLEECTRGSAARRD